MPSTFIDPFDFKKIFIQYFLGTTELFMFAFIIIFSYAAARFGMSNKVYFVLLIVSSLIMAGYLGQSIYVLIIFVIGLISYKAIGAIMS